MISIANDARTLPERIADHFIAKIFTGELTPGERLPPDRELAQQLGVDRTSLRMAMQRLAHLGLVRAVQGSGVRVLDYRRHAGVDLLSAVFQLPHLAIGGSLMLELLDDWIEMIPVLFGRAMARMTHDSARELDGLLLRQLAILSTDKDIDRLAALEIELQDGFARIVGNTTLMLMGNSNRAARLRLTKEHFQLSDVRVQVETHRDLLRHALKASGVPDSALALEYRAFLQKHTLPLRQRLQALPISPTRLPAASERLKPSAAKPKKRASGSRKRA
jgi:GntR family transcriptional repressor for pyruvate dehydrogenase complex